MTSIERNPDAVCSQRYDVIVIGGGIQGCCLTLEAARRGMRVLLLEREDYGGATSWNSLRIVHGGLRYLQHADWSRYRHSVTEQAWWLTHFPQLVKPLTCLMPLYDRGLRRRSVMRVALGVNDWLAAAVRRRAGYGDVRFDRGCVIRPQQTVERFPVVDRSELKGAAVWHDARMTSPQRLLIEVLRWACSRGADALNYMECTGLPRHADSVRGVRARCGVTDREFEFEAEHVVNCAGPWVSPVASLAGMQVDRDPGLALAFNVVIDRKPVAEEAVAVSAKHRGTTYFMVPCEQRTMLGTVHLPEGGLAEPTEAQIRGFIDELNELIPGYDLRRSEVTQVLSGRLPAFRVGSHLVGKSPKIIHHKTVLGATGLTSVIGVKYTTARYLAERTLREIRRLRGKDLPAYSDSSQPELAERPDLTVPLSAARDLQTWMQSESVVHIDDLLLRRCDLKIAEDQRFQLAEHIMRLVGWQSRSSEELGRLRKATASVALKTQC